MTSQAFENFNHAIQASADLMRHFDALNKQPPTPENEVLKRASLVMALAALETYFEDRVSEAVSTACQLSGSDERQTAFYRHSLEVDLTSFNSPSVDRVKMIFKKYLGLDVTEGWYWNNCIQDQAKVELNRLVRKRGDIAHRSLRPIPGHPVPHPVTKDDIRKHVHFIQQLVKATEEYLESNL